MQKKAPEKSPTTKPYITSHLTQEQPARTGLLAQRGCEKGKIDEILPPLFAKKTKDPSICKALQKESSCWDFFSAEKPPSKTQLNPRPPLFRIQIAQRNGRSSQTREIIEYMRNKWNKGGIFSWNIKAINQEKEMALLEILTETKITMLIQETWDGGKNLENMVRDRYVSHIYHGAPTEGERPMRGGGTMTVLPPSEMRVRTTKVGIDSQMVKVHLGNRGLWIFNIYLPQGNAETIRDLFEEIISIVRKVEDWSKVLIIGDLNINPTKEKAWRIFNEYLKMFELEIKNDVSIPTWRKTSEGKYSSTIDYAIGYKHNRIRVEYLPFMDHISDRRPLLIAVDDIELTPNTQNAFESSDTEQKVCSRAH